MKLCAKCKKNKRLSSFSKDPSNSSGYRYSCKSCEKPTVKLWRERNKKRRAKIDKAWRQRNPDRVYGYRIKKLYGISLYDYNVLLEKQNYACAICLTSHQPTKKMGRLVVDHDHATNKVRGLL